MFEIDSVSQKKEVMCSCLFFIKNYKLLLVYFFSSSYNILTIIKILKVMSQEIRRYKSNYNFLSNILNEILNY